MQVLIYTGYRDVIFFLSLTLSFGLILQGKLKSNWCGVSLGDHFHSFSFSLTPPDILLLVMPRFSFKPAILLPVRENFSEIWGLRDFLFFSKLLFS